MILNKSIYCLMLVVSLLCADIVPMYGQVKARRSDLPNEIRSGRSGAAEFGGGSTMRKNRRSEYGSRRNKQLFGSNESSAGKWAIGVSAGASCNWQTREAGYAYDMSFSERWGAIAGVSGTYQITDWVAARADIQFVQKGYEMRRMIPDMVIENIRTLYTYNYIQVPVMADWTFGTVVKSHIYTGGYGAFGLGGNIDRISLKTGAQQKYSYEFTPDDNRWEGGLVGGVGVTYDPLPYLRVGAEVLLYYSLSNTLKNQPVMNDRRYNNTVSIGINAKYLL